MIDIPRDAIFADSSFLFALIVRRDPFNAAAKAAYRAVSRDDRPIVTTNFVLVELHALMTNRVAASVATNALFEIEAGDTIIVRVKEEDEAKAREILRQHTDKGYSLLDATSFAVMRRLGIDSALSFDRHFVQFGWTVLSE